MRLAEKGPIIAPPVLEGWAHVASLEIQSWPGIISATHWSLHDPTQVDGADFYVGEAELGHIHLDGEIHLGLTRPLRKALTDAKLAEPFQWAHHWVQFPITDQSSTQHAIWLFLLGYDRLNGARSRELQRRICEAPDRRSVRFGRGPTWPPAGTTSIRRRALVES
jgi:luciferase-like monooxygenase